MSGGVSWYSDGRTTYLTYGSQKEDTPEKQKVAHGINACPGAPVKVSRKERDEDHACGNIGLHVGTFDRLKLAIVRCISDKLQWPLDSARMPMPSPLANDEAVRLVSEWDGWDKVSSGIPFNPFSYAWAAQYDGESFFMNDEYIDYTDVVDACSWRILIHDWPSRPRSLVYDV